MDEFGQKKEGLGGYAALKQTFAAGPQLFPQGRRDVAGGGILISGRSP